MFLDPRVALIDTRGSRTKYHLILSNYHIYDELQTPSQKATYRRRKRVRTQRDLKVF